MHKITVVGLGSGRLESLPYATYHKLLQAPVVYVRTLHHPVAQELLERGVHMLSFDQVYDQAQRYEEVYPEIVHRLLQRAEQQEVVYAVPGHPMVAEKSVQLLRAEAQQRGMPLEILPAPSFLDPAFSRLGVDPVEQGFLLLDGTQLHRRLLNPFVYTLISQIYDQQVASEVKLTLMEVYPDDAPVIVGNALGVAGEEKIEQLPLYQLDWESRRFGHLTLVAVPPLLDEQALGRRYETLLEMIQRLRGPDGCPWDREQTHASLRRYLLEETAEVLSAIDQEDPDALEEELGDLLLQIVLHAQIASEEGYFHMDDVIGALSAKIIRRHPHVFGEEKAHSAAEVERRWQLLKEKEGRKEGIGSLPQALAALEGARKLQSYAARWGFDWPDAEGVWEKINEEWQELKEAPAERRAEELGDVLFSLVNLARHWGIDPEAALAQTNQKFLRRFQHLERMAEQSGHKPGEVDMELMEQWWEQAKREEE